MAAGYIRGDEMTKKKSENKEEKKSNKKYLIVKVMFLILSLVSSIMVLVSVISGNILPSKYLIILIAVLGVFNIIFGLLLVVKNKIINVIGMVLVLIFSIVMFIGFGYVSKTFDNLRELVAPNEEILNYYILSLSDGEYENIQQLEGKVVGILEQGSEELIEELNKETNIEYKKYTSIGDLIYGLELKEVDAIIVSTTVYDLILEEDGSFENLVKKLGEVVVTGKPEKIESDINVGDSFILYISGLDSRDTSAVATTGLSDVNIVAVVNPTTHKVLLVNIPRDYYVDVYGRPGMKDKLTHAGLYGTNTSMKTVANIFDININTYVKVNFKALTNIVDAIDGIDVYSDTAFNSFHKKGWYVKKGMNHMDGEKALAYSRERYAYASGDRHRGKNQQDVIAAIIKKVSQNKQYLLKYNDILTSIQPYFTTNFELEDVQELVKNQIDTLSPWVVESISVDGANGQNYTASFPKSLTYVMVPNQTTIDNAKAKINQVMRGA